MLFPDSIYTTLSESILRIDSECLRKQTRMYPSKVEFDVFRSRVSELENTFTRAETGLEQQLDKMHRQ